jgi:hypothetical protein
MSEPQNLTRPAPGSPVTLFDSFLNELGRQRLAAGVTIYLETFCNSDHVCGPTWAARALDRSFIDLVETAAHACAVHDWSMVELKDGPTAWDDDESRVDLSVRRWGLHVSSNALWFNGMPKEGNEAVQTLELALTDLADALNARDEPDHGPEYFRWFGGALVYSQGDADALCEMVRDAVAEVDAKETELEMLRHIKRSSLSASAPSAAPEADMISTVPVPLRRRNRVV